MKTYRDNFDEFGNLREDHSPWRVRDLVGTVAAFGCVFVLMTGYLPVLLGGWS
jgi:hypothetical protein